MKLLVTAPDAGEGTCAIGACWEMTLEPESKTSSSSVSPEPSTDRTEC